MANDGPLAILFSDIRDFTAFTAERGDDVAYQVARTFLGLVEAHVLADDGTVVKTYGDGVMTAFNDCPSALSAAVAMQRALSNHNRAYPDDPIAAGIGIAWGEPIREDDDLFGHAVNLAKRLADFAKGGQIVVSDDVRQAAGAVDSLHYVDLGRPDLKGVGKPRVCELVWREELARLPLEKDQVALVLTADDTLAVELGRQAQTEIDQARAQLRAAAAQTGGWIGKILTKVERSLPTVVGRIVEIVQSGLEHPLQDIDMRIEDGAVVLTTPGREMRLTEDEVDLDEARAFIDSIRRRGSGPPSGGVDQ